LIDSSLGEQLELRHDNDTRIDWLMMSKGWYDIFCQNMCMFQTNLSKGLATHFFYAMKKIFGKFYTFCENCKQNVLRKFFSKYSKIFLTFFTL